MVQGSTNDVQWRPPHKMICADDEDSPAENDDNDEKTNGSE